MIGIAIITHGHFGEELLRTAQEIVGKQEQVQAFAVTSDVGTDHVCQFIDEAMRQSTSPEGILFLVDMLGGSPCNNVLLKIKDTSAEIVSGVNLYMLISAFTHRSRLDVRALALKTAEDGKRAITLPKDLLAKKAAP